MIRGERERGGQAETEIDIQTETQRQTDGDHTSISTQLT